MKKLSIIMGIWLLAAVMWAQAGDEKPRIFHGEVADTQCALNVHSLTRSHTEMLKSKNMGGTPGACASYCVRYLGGDFVLSSKNDVYRLDNQDKARQFVGEKVKITGTLEPKSKTIHVVAIEAVE
jgi:Protein of unknown function (DUF5818)